MKKTQSNTADNSAKRPHFAIFERAPLHSRRFSGNSFSNQVDLSRVAVCLRATNPELCDARCLWKKRCGSHSPLGCHPNATIHNDPHRSRLIHTPTNPKRVAWAMACTGHLSGGLPCCSWDTGRSPCRPPERHRLTLHFSLPRNGAARSPFHAIF